eukprot:CAMPEP_0206161870 /NCGR_PEP_ID=MMETSP1474-20131121/8713_1 /ASSEMBLY_ACC=CAM_ASM_001110 /TAXON_ID=97495 /ORGANISM="Imantonia sp., Strain RCC918" /LENGTH=59 /DNA_ID=CAMNT_0053563941 /DNA_START=7 /DNA_END=183 /DNA_ORIENTATION=+
MAMEDADLSTDAPVNTKPRMVVIAKRDEPKVLPLFDKLVHVLSLVVAGVIAVFVATVLA